MGVAITVTVESAPTDLADPSRWTVAFEGPRIVIGRGPGADLRLPDPSVSSRHASIRVRDGEWVLADEGSSNGTRIGAEAGAERLHPRAPVKLLPEQRIRVGRVWLRVRADGKPMEPTCAGRARDLAYNLVRATLRQQGISPDPVVTVTAGSDAGKELALLDNRDYQVSSDEKADLRLGIPTGVTLLVRKSGGGVHVSVAGGMAELDGIQLPEMVTVWRPGQVLALGGMSMSLSHEAGETLRDLEASSDENLPAPSAQAAQHSCTPVSSDAPLQSATRCDVPLPAPTQSSPRGILRAADGLVFTMAVATLAASTMGLMWVWGG